MSRIRSGFVPARQASRASSRTRAFTQSRLANRSVHTDSLPNVRRFTNNPLEGLVTGNRRAF